MNDESPRSQPVCFDALTGSLATVGSAVLRKLSAYTRGDRVAGFKIGITNDPIRRFREAYAHQYDEMIVVYRTSSIDNVSLLETILIEHNWELTDNEVAGGGGNIGHPPYYLYVALLH